MTIQPFLDSFNILFKCILGYKYILVKNEQGLSIV